MERESFFSAQFAAVKDKQNDVAYLSQLTEIQSAAWLNINYKKNRLFAFARSLILHPTQPFRLV